jgi:hypothetical protein
MTRNRYSVEVMETSNDETGVPWARIELWIDHVEGPFEELA